MSRQLVEMKASVVVSFVLLAIFNQPAAESRAIRRKKSDPLVDYEASGDYFEITVSNYELPESTSKKASSSSSSEEISSSDDGVTCSQSNITEVLASYDLDGHVLVIFKVNVTASERELVL